MKLGIVGHAEEKFTDKTREIAKQKIRIFVKQVKPNLIISGRSPMGGVDIYAEEIAKELGIPTRIFEPKQKRWDAPYGYKARNLDIAKHSDLVLCVVVKELPEGFDGMKFNCCYHCLKHSNPPPPHVKSGGCWTAWQCKRQAWIVV